LNKDFFFSTNINTRIKTNLHNRPDCQVSHRKIYKLMQIRHVEWHFILNGNFILYLRSISIAEISRSVGLLSFLSATIDPCYHLIVVTYTTMRKNENIKDKEWSWNQVDFTIFGRNKKTTDSEESKRKK
jgi:hypothetical protein